MLAKKTPIGGPGRSKYKAQRTTVDGMTFDSKKEAARWGELRMLSAGGQITGLLRQVEYPLVVEGQLITTYRADFRYVDASGETVVEDTKGVLTPVYRLKKKLMAAIYGIAIRET